MSIPLDPGAGGRSITSSALQTADIIVSTTSAFTSGVIRVGTSSEVSHTALYIGGDQVVEAIGEGVVIRDVETSLREDTLAVVYRLPNMTEEQRQKVRDYVGRQLGAKYSVSKALGAGLYYTDQTNPMTNAYICAKAGICMTDYSDSSRKSPVAEKTDTFFCSQLVFAAFQDAGIPLVGGMARYKTPKDFTDMWIMKVLVYVGHLKSN